MMPAGAGSVLVIEDDPAIVEALREVLEDDGFAVADARNGEQALSWLAENPAPDAILLDLMMPKMDGREFRARQLTVPAIAGIPTYVLTAGSDPRAPRMRADGWFGKPVRLTSLLATLRRTCGRRAAAREHTMFFYEEDAGLVDSVARFLAAALERGGAAVAVCTSEHERGLRAALAAAGHDPEALVALGRLVVVDAASTLASLRSPDDDEIDEGLVRARAGGLVDAARARAGEGQPVHVFGEMVDLLWHAGEYSSAVRLERWWDALVHERSFSLCCAYRDPGTKGADGDGRAGGADADLAAGAHAGGPDFAAVRALHGAVTA